MELKIPKLPNLYNRLSSPNFINIKPQANIKPQLDRPVLVLWCKLRMQPGLM